MIDYPKVRILAQAVLDAALTPFDVDNGHARIGASIGIAPVHKARQLRRRADPGGWRDVPD
ncbi:hypothetical protein E05_44090 [Plautia stali symbiont]|nr:hypothetical protein E05_44090 [Plautia stali symbiont]